MDSKIEQLVCHLGQAVCLCGLKDRATGVSSWSDGLPMWTQ